MKYLTQSRLYPDGLPAAGLLFLRLFAGYAMAQHGLVKIANPFGWMDRPGMPPSPVPDVLQALAAISEFFGGLGLIFGVLFPLACFGVMCTMFVASMSNLLKGEMLVDPMGGDSSEASALFFFVALALFLTGPSVLSVDYFLFGRKKAAAVAA